MDKDSSNKKLTTTLYKKLRPDGTVDSSSLNQSDFDQVAKYIKVTFPQASRVQKEIQQTLKRTFIFGKVDPNKQSDKDKSLCGFAEKSKPILNRKTRKRLQQMVPKNLKFEEFRHINTLWKAYVADLCGPDPHQADIQTKFNKIDLHGAFITVVQSNCKEYQGLCGIIIKETRNTFVIVNKSNLTKTIPKQESTFDIKLDNPDGLVRIAGNSFLSRPAERATRKIKSFINFTGPRVYKSRLKYGRIE